MPLKLLEATEDDGPNVMNVYIRAFHEDVFNQRLFPDMTIEKKLDGAKMRWHRNFSEPGMLYRMVVDEESGEVISYSKWAIIEGEKDVRDTTGASNESAAEATGERASEGFKADKEETNDEVDDDEDDDEVWPEGINRELCTEFSDQLIAHRKNLIGNRPQMQLRMLGTLPEYQGRGAGSMHLEWAAKIADEKGLVSYLDASPAGIKLYQRFGYEAREQVVTNLETWGGDEGTGKYRHVCMVREPKSRNSPIA